MAIRTPSQKKQAKPARTVPDAGSPMLGDQLCFALYSASLAMTKRYRPVLAELGLTYPQYLVMLALWEQDGPTVSELGLRVALDSGTLTPLLKRLQAQGLISRTRDATDERQVRIQLTKSGAALRRHAHAVHDHIACATECSSVERARLTTALQTLRGSLLANAVP